MKDLEALSDLAALCRQLNASGHSQGTGGNYSQMSFEYPDEFYISASGVDKGKLSPDLFLRVNDRGDIQGEANNYRPSDETLIHGQIIKKSPTYCQSIFF